jgi:hypothetical protein
MFVLEYKKTVMGGAKWIIQVGWNFITDLKRVG